MELLTRDPTHSLFMNLFPTVGQMGFKGECSKRRGAEAASLLKGFGKIA